MKDRLVSETQREQFRKEGYFILERVHFCRYSVRNESADSAQFGRNFNENDISAY